ncbi:MAG: double-cubane-cluster-containing anaerobic reductase [Syntrophobacter sp.]
MRDALRPESMQEFDHWSERCLLDFEAQKEAGKKVFGIYCVFAPSELVHAAGGIPVGLCGKKQKPIPDAERVLPANLCPLIKSSYGYALTDTCPYFSLSDFLIGETTCDGKVKMYELLGRIKPLHLLHQPRSDGPAELQSWLAEMHRLVDFLETRTGIAIREDELRRQIESHNAMRRSLKRLIYTCADDPVPLSGLDMMIVQETKSFAPNLQRYINAVDRLADEVVALKAKISGPAVKKPRVLLTGCPVGKGSEKVIRLIEDCGAAVVCQENCTGLKSFDLLVDEGEKDPLLALADRYLKTPCSCMTPNNGRLELLGRLINDFKIGGVVDLTWQCCHTYNVESFIIREFVEEKHGIPMLHIETDYTDSDSEQLRTRIEAFLEMVL